MYGKKRYQTYSLYYEEGWGGVGVTTTTEMDPNTSKTKFGEIRKDVHVSYYLK